MFIDIITGSQVRGSVFIPIPMKSNAKERANYCTIALISHASKVILKIPQARLQQTVENSERDGNTRPPDLPLEKFVCRSGSSS